MLCMVRRDFIKVSCKGVATLAFIIGACDDAVPVVPDQNAQPPPSANGLSLGKDDEALLNLSFVLKELQSSFYETLLQSPAFKSLFPEKTAEKQMLNLRNQAVIHRQLFKALSGNNDALAALTFDFSSFPLNSQADVLSHATEVGSITLAAYKSFPDLFKGESMGELLGSIVPVETESMNRLMLLSGTDTAVAAEVHPLKPAEVLLKIQPFITQQLDGSGLPG
jgi:hypothetical protein